MKIAKEKDKPDTFEGSVPPGIFPDQMTTGIQQAFNEYAKNRISDGPEPAIRYVQDFVLFLIQEGILEPK